MSRIRQKTIAREVFTEGVGLHTGEKVRMAFKPAPENTGIRFVRTDGNRRIEILADITTTVDSEGSSRRTILEKNGVRVSTVEHVLAAVAGLGIDNLWIELDAEEPAEPDGSALPFVRLLEKAGTEEQEAERFYLRVDRPIALQENGIELVALPHDGFRISFTIQYDNPLIGTQHVTFDIDEDSFVREVAPARTFALQNEVDRLREMGLIKGGSYSNAIVVENGKVESEERLRFEDEFVRHKVLDLLGDLFLVGMPLKGHIMAYKSGHSANVKLARLLRRYAEEKHGPTLKLRHETLSATNVDINFIMKIMPHRYPFLLVDRITELTEKRVVGIKNVTINEPFFIGHFPGHPIMPAVLIIEAMAQTGGILLLSSVDNPEHKLVYFMGIDDAKFRKPVLPGDTLRFELELIRLKTRTCKMRGRAYVGDDLVAGADLLSMIVDR
ncbi:MAG: bifunctional UDP-3-O-[3-hydroxymyristoyl] N-acetylglucosamine deacetylase/3-hydroxyacyl-ACP dehydratase [Candidatus Eisenbacteria bacterium]|nr:bifunctional UDP-3-O-[3-hydroxymyristoyl] N-acetylglucosamine deacetylase/3-hydroxyacyl-ACP dehydratase [Candidatus Eisenbacteria bacterium]